jgi:hypothetical protein
VFINLPFVGQERSHQWAFRLRKDVEKAFPAARVIVRWSTTRAFQPTLKDKLYANDMPGVVYHFECTCHQDYVGRTEQCLGERLKQHVPDWLNKGGTARPRSANAQESSITRHLLTCNSRPEKPREHFKLLHSGHSFHLNRILEALEIRQRTPALCVQKDRLYTLKLPW